MPEELPRIGALTKALFVLAAIAAALWGAAMVLLAFTVGNCAAFGGSCGNAPPPILDDDVFGMAFAGMILILIGPVLSQWRTSNRNWLVLLTLVFAVVIAVIARSSGY
jgi:hypothetical protein